MGMESPIGILAKLPTALQRCDSERAAVTIWPFGHLAKPQDACYIGFARYEDKSISSSRSEPSVVLQVGSDHSDAACENTGPSRPDFSKP
jgi:hypothetical protein